MGQVLPSRETWKLLCPSNRLRKRGEKGGAAFPGFVWTQVPGCPPGVGGPEVSHTGEEAVQVQKVSLKGKEVPTGRN